MIYIHQAVASCMLLPVAIIINTTTPLLRHFGIDVPFEIPTNYFQKFLRMTCQVRHQTLRFGQFDEAY